MTEPSREESIFLAARERTIGPERAGYLADACAGDDKLRARIEDLLRLNDQSQGPLDAPPPGMGTLSFHERWLRRYGKQNGNSYRPLVAHR